MAGEPPITLIGNLTGDPELRFTPSGAAVANFTIASTPRTLDKQSNEWKDGETLFISCSVWRQVAENVAESLTRGSRVVVHGRLKARSYDDRDGNKRTVFELDVEEIGASMRYATLKITKAARQGGDQGGFGGGQQQQPATQNDPWSNQAPANGGQNDPWSNSQQYPAGEPPF